MKHKFDSATPYIACFIIIRRGGKVAFVKRKNTNWMDGYYALPAGKVEWGERFMLAAIREAKEEIGITIPEDALRHVHTCHRHSEEIDWIDIYFEAESWQGEPYNAELDKSEELKWLDVEKNTKLIVPPQAFCLRLIAQGRPYSEYGWDV